MRKRHRSRLSIFIIITLAVCLCLGGLAVVGVTSLPMRAEHVFGPPASGLTTNQVIVYSFWLILNHENLTTPVGATGETISFEIDLAEPVHRVINRLSMAGLISDPEAFRIYIQYKGLDTSIQAGKYQLGPGMTPIEIAETLQDATPAQVQFGILPGWRLEEIAAGLLTSGLEFGPEAFLAEVRSPQGEYSLPITIPTQNSLEGLLFPGEYIFDRQTSVNDFIQTLLTEQSKYLSADLINGFGEQDLTPYEAFTLASIVQRESMTPEEMPIIASVFYNRLALDMKLESDPTVQYAIGFNPDQNTWWTNPLSAMDLQIDSRYNTYLYPGLPPGPIAAPGSLALHAVAAPAHTPYFYFRAACDGSPRHMFAETFPEHLANGCQ